MIRLLSTLSNNVYAYPMQPARNTPVETADAMPDQGRAYRYTAKFREPSKLIEANPVVDARNGTITVVLGNQINVSINIGNGRPSGNGPLTANEPRSSGDPTPEGGPVMVILHTVAAISCF